MVLCLKSIRRDMLLKLIGKGSMRETLMGIMKTQSDRALRYTSFEQG